MCETPEQKERVKSLLADTVTLLCKSSLTFNTELRIEGVIGITLDKQDIVLIHINDVFQPKHNVIQSNTSSTVSPFQFAEKLSTVSSISPLPHYIEPDKQLLSARQTSPTPVWSQLKRLSAPKISSNEPEKISAKHMLEMKNGSAQRVSSFTGDQYSALDKMSLKTETSSLSVSPSPKIFTTQPVFPGQLEDEPFQEENSCLEADIEIEESDDDNIILEKEIKHLTQSSCDQGDTEEDFNDIIESFTMEMEKDDCTTSNVTDRETRDDSQPISDVAIDTPLLRCEDCGRPFPNLSSLAEHTRSHRLSLLTCKWCCCKVNHKHFLRHVSKCRTVFNPLRKHGSFKSKSTPEDSQVSLPEVKKSFHCPVCLKSFAQKRYLTDHMRRHKPQHCAKCGLQFRFLTMQKHKLVCPGATNKNNTVNRNCVKIKEKDNKTDDQGVLIESKPQEDCLEEGNLKHHHSQVLKKLISLPIKKDFEFINTKPIDYNKQLTEFINTKGKDISKKLTGNQVFFCSVCGKEFAQRRYLHAHRDKHRTPSHKCEGCGKIFRFASSYYSHRKLCEKYYVKMKSNALASKTVIP